MVKLMKHEKHGEPRMVLKVEVEGQGPRNSGTTGNLEAKKRFSSSVFRRNKVWLSTSVELVRPVSDF